ncbi:saccharopine dehydrogenase family protein [Actinopolyspora mortivallis]|uniref:saccharopine dehydrogenase family protein n=1 Tax=Actinopolyspora mortivallis TaxID=33906 RepID=UPI000380B795|nr:saccharopine dehydrogenase NADP-binding domain-containing protein [Actinopolyspora mortivallis]
MVWMLYGATGYTGRLVAELAVRRGHRPVLAGRNPEALAALAVPHGLEYRTLDLRDPETLEAGLRDVDAVAHCAGPFSRTSAPMVEACLRTGTHYLDITGEIDVFERLFAEDERARASGVTLLPGAGFDVVPTDCLAAMVAARLPEATDLDLAFLPVGGVSPGTLKSVLEGVALGGRARVDGTLREVPVGWRRRSVDFPTGTRTVSALPWGDVATAYRTTGVGTITTFAHLPGLNRLKPALAEKLGRVLAVPPVRRAGETAVDLLARGPGRERRANSRVEVYAEAGDAEGNTVRAALVGPDTYDLTAEAVLRIVTDLSRGVLPTGTRTPATAFGPDLVRELPGVRVVEPEHVRAPE